MNKYKKGSTYISVCISLVIILFVLVFLIQSFALVSKKITLDRISYEIASYISQTGTVDSETLDLISYYKRKSNMDFDIYYDLDYYRDTNYVQLGDRISIRLEYVSYFSALKIFPIKLTSENTILSKTYIKGN